MKKLLLLSLIILSLISCKSDKANNDKPKNKRQQDQSATLKLKDIASIYQYDQINTLFSNTLCLIECSIKSTANLNTKFSRLSAPLDCEKSYSINKNEFKEGFLKTFPVEDRNTGDEEVYPTAEQFVVVKELLDYQKSLEQDPDLSPISIDDTSCNNLTGGSVLNRNIIVTKSVLEEYNAHSNTKWLPYIDNKTPTLTSSSSITMWKDKSTGYYWTTGNDTKNKNWSDAVNYCENLNYGGFSNWTLPSLDRIKNIDFSETPLPSSSWTTTTEAGGKMAAYLSTGSTLDTTLTRPVVCVR